VCVFVRNQRFEHNLRDRVNNSEVDMSQMAEHLAPAVFRSGNAAPSAECLHGRVNASFARHWTVPSIGGSKDVNDAWIHLRDDLVAKAQPFNRTRTHVVDENVALSHDAERDG